jgi:hypothetical protein
MAVSTRLSLPSFDPPLGPNACLAIPGALQNIRTSHHIPARRYTNQPLSIDQRPTMTIYNALSFPPFRSIKLRPRREACIACGASSLLPARIPTNKATVSSTGKDATERRARERAEGLEVTLPAVDYVQFCGGPTPDWEREGQVSGQEGERMRAGVSCLLSSISTNSLALYSP